MDKKFNSTDFGLGLLIGLAMGAIGGIFLAPQSGKKTRDGLATRAADIRVSSHELIENARHNIEQASLKIEGVMGRQDRSIRKKLDAIKSELDEYDLKGVETLETP